MRTLSAPQFGSYRDDATARGFVVRVSEHHLAAASDALNLALLTLGGAHIDDSRPDKHRRTEQARAFLAEAVTAFSRARIYVRGIHTLSLPVLLDTEDDVDAELSRLHQLATRLLWHNHAHLPERRVQPLAPEEEAQLAVVVRGLARHAKIDRALRYKWALLALVTAGAAGFAGSVWLAAVACVVGLVFALIRWSDSSRLSPAIAG